MPLVFNRTLLYFLCLLSLKCSGQAAKQPATEIDTSIAKDKANKPIAGDRMVFEAGNYVILYAQNFAFQSSGTVTRLSKLSELCEYIKQHSTEIQGKRVYILSDSATQILDIEAVISLLKGYGITDIKRINLQEFLKPPSPDNLEQPRVSTTIEKIDDSKFFVIEITKTDYQVRFFGEALRTSSSGDVENFVLAHKSTIKNGEIKIIDSEDVKFDQIKPIFEIMRKHGFTKFQIGQR